MPPEEWKSVAWIWLLSPSSDFLIRSLGYQLSAAHASVTVDIEPRETLHYRSSIWCCHTSCQPDCLESTCSSPSVRVKWCEIHTNGGSLCYKYEWMNDWLTGWLTDWMNELQLNCSNYMWTTACKSCVLVRCNLNPPKTWHGKNKHEAVEVCSTWLGKHAPSPVWIHRDMGSARSLHHVRDERSQTIWQLFVWWTAWDCRLCISLLTCASCIIPSLFPRNEIAVERKQRDWSHPLNSCLKCIFYILHSCIGRF